MARAAGPGTLHAGDGHAVPLHRHASQPRYKGPAGWLTSGSAVLGGKPMPTADGGRRDLTSPSCVPDRLRASAAGSCRTDPSPVASRAPMCQRRPGETEDCRRQAPSRPPTGEVASPAGNAPDAAPITATVVVPMTAGSLVPSIRSVGVPDPLWSRSGRRIDDEATRRICSAIAGAAEFPAGACRQPGGSLPRTSPDSR